MKKKEEKITYYSLTNILRVNADYNIIYGERSNGKTTAVQGYALHDYITSGFRNQFAVIRRWKEDFRGKNMKNMFAGVILEWLVKWSKGEYNSIWYWAGAWYLVHYNDKGEKDKQSETPFAFAFALDEEEHYKSTSFPHIRTVLFDEFITRNYYLPNEFIAFQSVLSTIIRNRDDVKIFMCGNTINRYCIYFNEMGLKGVRTQKKGTIDTYSYGDTGLVVAVEYADSPSKHKPSNKYFAFDNPKLKMITEGEWEIAIYPHLPMKYYPTDIRYIYFVNFDSELLQCEIINRQGTWFTYIHRKTTPIKDSKRELVFDTDYHPEARYRRRLSSPIDEYGKAIWKFFTAEKVFYQDNEVGEIMNNYLKWCETN